MMVVSAFVWCDVIRSRSQIPAGQRTEQTFTSPIEEGNEVLERVDRCDLPCFGVLELETDETMDRWR